MDTYEATVEARERYVPIQQVDTPFLPLAEILEVAESGAAFEEEVWTPGKPTPEQVAFREAVLKYHIAARIKQGKKQQPDPPPSALKTVPGLKVSMRKDAAEAAGRLIADARKALADARGAGDADALRITSLGATSGFRSSKKQVDLWRQYFPKYYARTQVARSKASGGEHGSEAVKIAFNETAQWIAAPGFSTHSAGTAIDLAQFRTKGHRIGNSSKASDLAAWRKSWFYKWLVANAATYGFQPYKKEPWHWEYKPTALEAREDELAAEEYAMAELDQEGHLGEEYDTEESTAAEEEEEESGAFEQPEFEEYMSAQELDQTESTELGEGETGVATQEFWGIPMPFIATAPSTTPTAAPTTGTLPRNAKLVSSCLTALALIPSMTAKYQSARRKLIDEIVIHDTASGEKSSWARIKSYLAAPGDGRQVSIHYIIGRDEGQLVAQVPEHRKAWHVAAKGHNDRSVGIELFKRRKVDKGFSDWQYRAVSELVYDLMLRYRVPPANVIAHKWVQSNRDDPQGFDWTKFGQMLGQIAVCAGGIDQSLIVANAAEAGARGRTATTAPTKELDEEFEELGEAEGLEEYMTDLEEEEPGEEELFEEEVEELDSGFEDGAEFETPTGEDAEYESEKEGVASTGALRMFDGYMDSEAPAPSGIVDRIKGVAALTFGAALRRGDKGTAVAALQRALASLGLDVVQDGDFGANTDRAVRTFQARSGLTADGIVGGQTKAALASAVSARGGGAAAPPAAPGGAAAVPSRGVSDWTRWSLDARARYVMELLVDRYGYPVNGAAGLVGNLIAESALLPNRIEGSDPKTPMRAKNFQDQVVEFTAREIRDRIFEKRGPRRPGIGLAQWTTPDRRSGLFQHTFQGQQLGTEILFDMDAQVDYLVNELRSRQYAGVEGVLRAPNVTVNDATDEVVYRFEIPGSILDNSTPRRKLLPRSDARVQRVFSRRRTNSERALRAYRAAHP